MDIEMELVDRLSAWRYREAGTLGPLPVTGSRRHAEALLKRAYEKRLSTAGFSRPEARIGAQREAEFQRRKAKRDRRKARKARRLEAWRQGKRASE